MRRSDEELAAAGMPGYEDYTTTNAADKPRLENYHGIANTWADGQVKYGGKWSFI